ncbi:MAG TPA: NADH-quinone oxidoreductase subunit NuoE [Rhodospirillales bacterium]|nr:NADH-quinone oxidoreductase subunit NuoE [Rhodospirillales bacterium]
MTVQDAIKQAPNEPFSFSEENVAEARRLIAKYPEGRQQSAVMGLLYLAQKQNNGWLSQPALEHIAQFLGMPVIRVAEVATFYTMYNLQPMGRHHVQVCTNLSCWLRGSDEIMDACRDALGIEIGGTTEDGGFTLSEVECLCACVNAPIVQIDDDFYEDLTPESIRTILAELRAGRAPKTGSHIGRTSSEPVGGLTTLTTTGTGPNGGPGRGDA